MDKELINILKSHKDDPQLGGGFDAEKRWQQVAAVSGLEEETASRAYGVREYVEYGVWHMSHMMLKPAAAFVAIFLFVFASWASVVTTSAHAVPGDTFYPAKISLEKIQLAVTFDPAQRAQLKVQFVSNRLDEMVILAASNPVDHPEVVQLAADRFTQEVQILKEELQDESGDSASNTELAMIVGRKAPIYTTTIAQSGQQVSDNIKAVVEEVQDAVEETQEQAVDVIITAHEIEEGEEMAREILLAFESKLSSLNNSDLTDEQKEKIDIAISLKIQGEYRKAFQLLKEIELQ